ncbi:MAG TPA: methyltransferase domain-containing protein [Gemmatimonadaceae bacterium]|nr:methyltransferase domain-containing protein [Gemmatimonadaceae bacterium]
MQADDSIEQQIVRSWTDNADAWTHVVRAGLIPSRGAGTDAAIVRACAAIGRGPMLDVGCGEGWLVRELAARGIEAHGIDVSEALVAQASARSGSFSVATYAQIEADDRCAAGPWQAIVCNFALLGDPLHPLLAALRARLAPGGTLLVQTVHPWTARGDAPYRGEWRTERFEAFGTAFPSPMPWYYRPLASWHEQFALAGLRVSGVDEPVHPHTGTPLSLLFRCEAA